MDNLDCGEQRCIDLARAYELGSGRPRDYRAAAGAYERGCDKGAGDGEACRNLAVAYIRGVGVDRSVPTATKLVDQACKLDDDVACWVAFEIERQHAFHIATNGDVATIDARPRRWRERYGADSPRTIALQKRIAAACDGGVVAACSAVACGKSCGQDGSRGERARESHQLRLCPKGVNSACGNVMRRLEESAETKAALERVKTDCTAGDPAACAALGQAIPLEELCRAHDYRACKEIERQQSP